MAIPYDHIVLPARTTLKPQRSHHVDAVTHMLDCRAGNRLCIPVVAAVAGALLVVLAMLDIVMVLYGIL